MRRIEIRPVLAGSIAELVYLAGLIAVTPLEAAYLGSLLLVLATGLVGGNVTGWLLERPERAARNGLVCGTFGGGVFAWLFWHMMVTPGASHGAFRGLAYLLATNVPGPGFAAQYGTVLIAVLAVLGWGIIVFGTVRASTHAARHPPRLFGQGKR